MSPDRSGGIKRPTDGRFQTYSGPDVFVPQDQVQDYLAKHRIQRREVNGGEIVGTTRRVPRGRYANIELGFPHAPYNEPHGIRGVSHLVEHLVLYPPLFESFRSRVELNGSTHPSDVTFTLEGNSSRLVPDFRIWPVIPAIFSSMQTPLDIPYSRLQTEKGIVFDEMHKKEHGLGDAWGDKSYLIRSIFPPEHPSHHITAGSVDEINAISVADVEEYRQRIFTPRGLDVAVYAEGNPQTTTAILDLLEENMATMTGTSEPVRLDPNLGTRFHPDYVQGETYMQNTRGRREVKRGRQRIHYVWALPAGAYSAENIAQGNFFSVAYDRLFEAMRANEVGYDAEPIDMDIDGYRVLGYSLDIQRRRGRDLPKYAHRLYHDWGHPTFESFDARELGEVSRISHNEMVTEAVTEEDRLGDVRNGLQTYGRIIDSDKKRRLQLGVTTDHLREVRRQFVQIQPTIIIEGDLTK